MYTTTLLDEHMTKIKVVDLEKLYNFVVDNFLICILSKKSMFEFLTLKLEVFKWPWMDKQQKNESYRS